MLDTHATRVALVTNIPAPYRMAVYDSLATDPQLEFKVYFCSGREPDRQWDLSESSFEKLHLNERFIRYKGRFIHINPDVWAALRTFRPEVVITTGFNPTHLIAYLYARVYGARHIAMTDGTFESEIRLSGIHRWVRRRVYAGSQAFIGASDGAFKLYRSYGIDANRIVKSHLCANNEAFFKAPATEKRFDFIFCGRFVAIKNPLFAIQVAHQVAKRLGRRVSIVFVGSGEMEKEIRTASDAVANDVEAVFAGFARQEALPQLYGSARIFLFPTSWDPWGVVANEACAAGLPVLVTPFAGSANELIRDGQNGFVMPLDIEQWTDAAVRMLSDSGFYQAMSEKSRKLVGEYSYDHAAAGIAEAVKISLGEKSSGALSKRPHVVIIQRRMTHYRIPLFDLLREKLNKAGVELTVVFGDSTQEEQKKNDSGHLSWGVHVPCKYWLNGHLCWQNAGAVVRNADLVVVTQENRLLLNYLLEAVRRPNALAFWGHGRNFQAPNRNSLGERLKRRMVTKADWWFAYTEVSARVVAEAGFPKDRVTILNNSIDTCELANDLAGITDAELQQAREAFGIAPGAVGMLIASLHVDKRLGFLLEAAQQVRQRIPDFQLVIVGDGPQRDMVQHAVQQANGWIHWLGARKGHEKALLLKIAKVMLNPGMVGLGILDSFVAKLPMVTTLNENHSPEIAYLEDGINGLMTPNDIGAYANAVHCLLEDTGQYKKLQEGCERSAENVSLEKMAVRFCEGIEQCLQHGSAMPFAGQTA